MLIEKYFDNIKHSIKDFSPFILSEAITFESRSATLGKIKGYVVFVDSSKLYLLEIIDTIQSDKIQYSYHYQTGVEKIVFRYDNAPHHKEIKTFPHHKHFTSEQNVLPTEEPTLQSILKEIVVSFLIYTI